MNQEELCDKLVELGFESGWAVRNGKIVVWENTTKVPNELKQYVDLD
jgi:predicted kinase